MNLFETDHVRYERDPLEIAVTKAYPLTQKKKKKVKNHMKQIECTSVDKTCRVGDYGLYFLRPSHPCKTGYLFSYNSRAS